MQDVPTDGSSRFFFVVRMRLMSEPIFLYISGSIQSLKSFHCSHVAKPLIEREFAIAVVLRALKIEVKKLRMDRR